MSSNASMEEVKCFLGDGYRTSFLAEEVKENWAQDNVTVNYLLEFLPLQPSCSEWLTAVSGVPYHPKYVAERYSVKSSTINSFSKFCILLQEAKYLRSLCRNQDGEWLDAKDAKQNI